MRRYYFHLRNHAGRSLDGAGRLLPNRGAAIREALEAARAIMRTPADSTVAEAWRGWQSEVIDDEGIPVLVLPFRSALSDPPQEQNGALQSHGQNSHVDG